MEDIAGGSGMTACDFSVDVRVVAADGATVRANLNDPDNGLVVEFYQEPDESRREVTVESDYVDGDYAVAGRDTAGTHVVVLRVEGSTWGEVETRWQAVRTAYRADSGFYLETATEGVTKRWECRRPDVSPGATENVSLMHKAQGYTLRFPVQPNPTVTVA